MRPDPLRYGIVSWCPRKTLHVVAAVSERLISRLFQKEVAAVGASCDLAVQMVQFQGTALSVLEPGIYWGAYSPVLTALQAAIT